LTSAERKQFVLLHQIKSPELWHRPNLWHHCHPVQISFPVWILLENLSLSWNI